MKLTGQGVSHRKFQDEIDASLIATADRLKVIARFGVGFDRMEVVAATTCRRVVTNAPGANSAAVAELTIGSGMAYEESFMVSRHRPGDR
jgi:phosphoglycerate dehydrogenase-like enzyme